MLKTIKLDRHAQLMLKTIKLAMCSPPLPKKKIKPTPNLVKCLSRMNYFEPYYLLIQ